MMNWTDLLSTGRIGVKGNAAVGREESPFLLDLDRITFSSIFRRLQDKTQVHPLSVGGRVRSRLTHSIEVASVGRSLGFGVGQRLIEAKRPIPEYITPHDFGYIVQVACLSHDIGNPPFGHAGEAAIAQWFCDNGDWAFDPSMEEAEKTDLTHFEGNAQGFRILNKLDYFRDQGGFRMTYATLGAFTKYPGDSTNKKSALIEAKKSGFCQSEKEIFTQIAKQLGLKKRRGQTLWCRHPLAYLMEAADDICYRVADLEDGVTMECVSFEEVERHLAPLARSPEKYPGGAKKRWKDLRKEDWYKVMGQQEKLGFLRGKAISNLTKATVDVFVDNEERLLAGKFDDELLSLTPFSKDAKACKKFAGQSIFGTRRKLEIETASFEILGELLNVFVKAVLDFEYKSGALSEVSQQNQRLLKMMDHEISFKKNRYEHLLQVTDFISGLSDRSAVNLFKTLKGVSL